MWGEDQYLKWLFFTPTTEVNICNKLSKLRLGTKISQTFVGQIKGEEDTRVRDWKFVEKATLYPLRPNSFLQQGFVKEGWRMKVLLEHSNYDMNSILTPTQENNN
jgi:hypothetical protein